MYYELVQRFYIHRSLYEPQPIVHCPEDLCSIGFIAKLSAVAIFELLMEVVKFHQLLYSLFIEQTSDAHSPAARGQRASVGVIITIN